MTITHILVHGFGSFPIFYKPLIELAMVRNPEIEWSMSLPVAVHLKNMTKLLGENNVIYLPEEIKKIASKNKTINNLDSYYGNIYRDLESDKKNLKGKKASIQLDYAISVYLVYKNKLNILKPTHVLFANIEGTEGLILYAVSKELGIKTIISTHARNLGGSFFSSDIYESLPTNIEYNMDDIEKAKQFLREFRQKHIVANNVPEEVNSKAIIVKKELFLLRVFNFIKRIINEKENRAFDNLKASVLNNVPLIRDGYWEIKKKINSRHYDVSEADDINFKYIFYPLQYSPESSINTPAPYYIDQRRVIDAIRMNMPSDMILLVKEHPSCIYVRPGSFMKGLGKCPGVVRVKHDMDTRELIKKASLTISVTGTATWEAFLLGKPSMALGGAFFSDFLGGVSGLDEIRENIVDSMNKIIKDDDIIIALAKMHRVIKPFVLMATDYGDNPTMKEQNIKNFLGALMEYISDDVSIIDK